MSRRRRTLLIGGAVIAVVIILGLVLANRFRARAQELAQPQTGEIVAVDRGDLAASATASGQVQARREATLALASSGEVVEVAVDVGDTVAAGDVLVRLETAALERALAGAEQTLAIQEANLESLQAGPTAADLAAAEAGVTSAQARLDDLRDGPSAEEVAQAEANLRSAEANLRAAQNSLAQTQNSSDEAAILRAQQNVDDLSTALESAEQALTRTLECEQLANGEWDCEPRFDEELTRQAELQVVQARENLAAAQAQLDRLLAGADPNQVRASQANVGTMTARRDAAQAQLDLLLAGPTDAEIASAAAALADAVSARAQLQAGAGAAQIASAEARLEQARVGVQRAQQNLDDAALRAPFAGVVTGVFVSEGEIASGPAISLVDLDSLEVVLAVDEIDIGDLEVGQPALVTVQAWPDTEIESEVVAISPAANSLALNSSIASFPVHLSLANTDLPLRVGMTADAQLQTARRADVLLLPNRAITPDRQTGRFYVNLVTTGPDGEETTEVVEVTIGLRDAQFTQITGGLDEGDRVRVAPAQIPGQEDFGPFGGPPNGGPGGGPPGSGGGF